MLPPCSGPKTPILRCAGVLVTGSTPRPTGRSLVGLGLTMSRSFAAVRSHPVCSPMTTSMWSAGPPSRPGRTCLSNGQPRFPMSMSCRSGRCGVSGCAPATVAKGSRTHFLTELSGTRNQKVHQRSRATRWTIGQKGGPHDGLRGHAQAFRGRRLRQGCEHRLSLRWVPTRAYAAGPALSGISAQLPVQLLSDHWSARPLDPRLVPDWFR